MNANDEPSFAPGRRELGGFDRDVDQLLELIQGNPNAIGMELLQRICASLAAVLRGRFANLTPADVDDVIGTSIVRFVEVGRKEGRVRRDKSPAAYLTSIARNAAYDLVRHRQRASAKDSALAQVLVTESAEETTLSRLLTSDAVHAQVGPAMTAAIARGDDVLVRVVASWLDLADIFGVSPTTRQVAEHAGVSHTTVRRALQRFSLLISG